MLQESILQNFRPSLSYHLSLRFLFCLFLSDRFTQLLLYSLCNALFPPFVVRQKRTIYTIFVNFGEPVPEKPIEAAVKRLKSKYVNPQWEMEVRKVKHCLYAYLCLFCCFTSQVNSYGHGGTVSSPNYTFSWASLNKQLTSTLCTYFRL